jgi:uncharacterized metal-binding protein
MRVRILFLILTLNDVFGFYRLTPDLDVHSDPTTLEAGGAHRWTHTRTSTHPYEDTYAHTIPIITSERLSRLNFKIHEVCHQEHLTVDRDITSH